jgi:hypothetical protein
VKQLIRLLPMTAGLIGIALIIACTSDEIMGANAGNPAFAEVGATTTTPCSPQPDASSSGWIGPRGGRLKAGKHTLWIPAGALKNPTFITMYAPSSTVNQVVFSPDGLVFDSKYPAQLVMSYQNCFVSPAAEQQVAYVNELFQVIEFTPSQTDPQTLTVKAWLKHFSTYALMSTYAVAY